MEFKIKQSSLRNALSAVSGCLPKKTTIPVLGMILIETLGENQIRLTATDLDVTMRQDTDAEIVAGGSICVEGGRLIALVQALAADSDVNIVTEPNNWVRVSAGKSKFRFAGTGSDRFPEPVKRVPELLKISGKALRNVLSKTSFSVDLSTHNFERHGVLAEISETGLRGVATDGYRMPMIDVEIDDGVEASFTIPQRAALEILARFDDDDEISISADDKHIFFANGDGLLTSRKISADFPNYRFVMNLADGLDLSATFDAKAMRESIKRVSLMSGQMQTISIELYGGEGIINAIGYSEGEGEERLPVEFYGPEIVLGFVWPQLLSILQHSDGQVKMSFCEDPLKPVFLSPVDEPNFSCMVTQSRVGVAKLREAA